MKSSTRVLEAESWYLTNVTERTCNFQSILQLKCFNWQFVWPCRHPWWCCLATPGPSATRLGPAWWKKLMYNCISHWILQGRDRSLLKKGNWIHTLKISFLMRRLEVWSLCGRSFRHLATWLSPAAISQLLFWRFWNQCPSLKHFELLLVIEANVFR